MPEPPPSTKFRLRDQIMYELNLAGLLDWEGAPYGSPEFRERADIATIQLIRIVQTLATEIDRHRHEPHPGPRRP